MVPGCVRVDSCWTTSHPSCHPRAQLHAQYILIIRGVVGYSDTARCSPAVAEGRVLGAAGKAVALLIRAADGCTQSGGEAGAHDSTHAPRNTHARCVARRPYSSAPLGVRRHARIEVVRGGDHSAKLPAGLAGRHSCTLPGCTCLQAAVAAQHSSCEAAGRGNPSPAPPAAAAPPRRSPAAAAAAHRCRITCCPAGHI